MFNELLRIGVDVFILWVFVLPFFYLVLRLALIMVGQDHIVKKWEGKKYGTYRQARFMDMNYKTPKDNYLEEIHNNPTYSHYGSNHYHNIYEQTKR